jgi:hypothetical protein
LKLAWRVAKDTGDGGRSSVPAHFASEWLVVARKAAYLQHLHNVIEGERHLEWSEPESTGKHLWRDGKAHDLKPLARPPIK